MSDGDDALTIGNGNPFMVPPTVPVAATSAAPANVLGAAGTPPAVAPDNPLVGLPATSRGMRNNNPGNLESNSWTSSLPGYTGTDGRFAQFKTPEAGLAALDQNLVGYGHKGLNTPLAIASTWAPEGETGNNPGAYGSAIAQHLGIGPTDKVNMADPAVRAKIAQAIVEVENGKASGSSGVATSDHGQPMKLAGAADTSGSALAAAPTSGFNPKGLYTMAMLSSMFPNHKFSPVEYDPFKVMPHQPGVGN